MKVHVHQACYDQPLSDFDLFPPIAELSPFSFFTMERSSPVISVYGTILSGLLPLRVPFTSSLLVSKQPESSEKLTLGERLLLTGKSMAVFPVEFFFLGAGKDFLCTKSGFLLFFLGFDCSVFSLLG